MILSLTVPNNIELRELKCPQRDYLPHVKCEAILSGGCEEQNGPNFEVTISTKTFLKCNNSFFHHYEAYVNPINERITLNFSSSLLYGQNYSAAVYIHNEIGSGPNMNLSFKTDEKSE